MSDIVRYSSSELSRMTVDDLRQELAMSVTITAENLYYMGMVWRELECRGEDLSELRAGIGAYLPMIATGRLKAEAVVRYAGKAMLLSRMAELPMEEQEKLLEDDEIEVAEIIDGEVEVRTTSLSDVRADQLRVVFGPVGVRNIEQQKKLVQAVAVPKKRSRYVAGATLNISPDGFLRHGRAHISARGNRVHIDDILTAIREAYGVKIELPEK